MSDFFVNSVFFGVIISLLSYGAGDLLRRRFKLAIFNPLLIAVALTMTVLTVFKIDYDIYNEGAKYISYLLTPATVCLAVPLYEKLNVLRKNSKALLIGILSGTVTSLMTVFTMALFLGFDHTGYVTLLPKSITTAIGMGVSEELGGHVALTVAVIVITGVLGNMMAVPVCKLFRINDPIAKGVAIGSSSHAVGTAKALELGKTEGAVSSLSIVVSGIFTVIGANLMESLI